MLEFQLHLWGGIISASGISASVCLDSTSDMLSLGWRCRFRRASTKTRGRRSSHRTGCSIRHSYRTGGHRRRTHLVTPPQRCRFRRASISTRRRRGNHHVGCCIRHRNRTGGHRKRTHIVTPPDFVCSTSIRVGALNNLLIATPQSCPLLVTCLA